MLLSARRVVVILLTVGVLLHFGALVESSTPTESPTIAPTNIRACDSCSAGEYYDTTPISETAVVGCTSCPAGYTCTGACSGPTACPAGYYGASTHQLPGTCDLCPLGSYNLQEGMSSCNECPAGYMCSNQTAAPKICGVGWYSLSGSTECVECGAGEYSIVVGATACNNCSAGFMCPSGISGKLAIILVRRVMLSLSAYHITLYF